MSGTAVGLSVLLYTTLGVTLLFILVNKAEDNNTNNGSKFSQNSKQRTSVLTLETLNQWKWALQNEDQTVTVQHICPDFSPSNQVRVFFLSEEVLRTRYDYKLQGTVIGTDLIMFQAYRSPDSSMFTVLSDIDKKELMNCTEYLVELRDLNTYRIRAKIHGPTSWHDNGTAFSSSLWIADSLGSFAMVYKAKRLKEQYPYGWSFSSALLSTDLWSPQVIAAVMAVQSFSEPRPWLAQDQCNIVFFNGAVMFCGFSVFLIMVATVLFICRRDKEDNKQKI